MSSDQLFDQRTLDYLSVKGYVFNGIGSIDGVKRAWMENSFFIFNKDKEGLRETHRKIMIQMTASIITQMRYDNVASILSVLRNQGLPYNHVILSLEGNFVFPLYDIFFKEAGDDEGGDFRWPRKVLKCPHSRYLERDEERWVFVGESNVPHVLWGGRIDREGIIGFFRTLYRAYYNLPQKPRPIFNLRNWQAEPLENIS